LTIAYNAKTGHRRWMRRYDENRRFDEAVAIAASRRGVVVVAGTTGGFVHATVVAYAGATGRPLWTRRAGRAGAWFAVTATDGRAYVTGSTVGESTSDLDYALTSYGLRSGRRIWSKRYGIAGRDAEYPWAVVLSGDRKCVYLAGQSANELLESDFLTVAYRARDGRRAWASNYNSAAGGTSDDFGTAAAARVVGRGVFVAGSFDFSRYGILAYLAPRASTSC
jgi:hypothetical protein